MPRQIVVILIVLGLLGAVAGTPRALGERVEPPRRVSFRLADDSGLLRGLLVEWDRRSITIETPEGADRRAWTAIEARSAYDVLRRIINRRDADAWLELGALMLSMGDDRLGESAFQVATRLEPEAQSIVDRILDAHRTGGSVFGALDEATDGQESIDETPARPTRPDPDRPAPPDDAGPGEPGETIRFGTTRPDRSGADVAEGPWPTLTPEEHAAAERRLRERASEWLARIGREIEPIETEHYLVYTDLATPEARRWTRELDRMHRTLATMLEMDPEARIFAGKCVIYIFRERADFLAFEKAAFGFDASRAAGVCHMRGDEVHICFFRPAEQTRFQSVLIHETTHGFFYRYRSPNHLPEWANEGLADYVAGVLTPRSTEPQQHWQQALQFIRRGGEALSIMNQTYEDGTWFTNDSYPVSHMLVRFMLKHEPRGFKEWIDAVKNGADWREALLERFNVTPERLSEGFARDIEQERGYTPLR